MVESAFFGAVIGFLAGSALGLLLCQGNACVTWFRDLAPVIVLGLAGVGLLLGGLTGAVWGSWAAGEHS